MPYKTAILIADILYDMVYRIPLYNEYDYT